MYLGGEEAARATVETREIHSKSREREALHYSRYFSSIARGGEESFKCFSSSPKRGGN